MPRLSRLTARVAAHGFRQQITTIGHADDLGNESEEVIRRYWHGIVKSVARDNGPLSRFRPHETTEVVNALLRALDRELQDLFAKRLGWIAVQSHNRTADGLSDQLPLDSLRSSVTEEETGPGIVQLFLTKAAKKLRTRDLAKPLDNPDLSADAKRDLLRELVFPPPDARQVFGVVYAGDWRKRIEAQTRLAAPRDVARIIQQGFVSGASQRDIAKALLPVVDGVRSTARRVARNESMRVSHILQSQAWAEVDDLIGGYQVHAIDDGHNPTSRPEHKARHLTVYWKKPKGSQKGLDERPFPPYEADGKIAHNCRCFLTPVFLPHPPAKSEIANEPLDPDIVSAWFDDASERDRRAAVGNQRYKIAKSYLDRVPTWLDFVNSQGQLWTVQELIALLTGSQ